MAVPSLPFTFSANTLIQSAQVNSNFSALVSAISANLDSTNFSLARGLGANFIVGTGSGNSGAFQGGAYVFTPNTNAVVPLSVVGLAGQSVDLFDVSTSAAKAVWVDSAGGFHATTPAQITPSGTAGAASAALYFGNNQGGTGRAFLVTQSAATVAGVTGSVFVAGQDGVLNAAALDVTGNFGVAAMLKAGTGIIVNGPLSAATTGGFSGAVTAPTFAGALTGNADTATKLATAKAINGVNFDGSAPITIKATATNALTAGTHLSGGPYDGSAPITFLTDAVSTNTPSTIVARDGSGNFAAGAVTLGTPLALGSGGTGSATLAGAGIVTTADAGTVTNVMLAGSIAQSKLAAFAGVAVGGALTGATTGAFSGSVSSVGHVSTGANMQVLDTTAGAHGMRLTNTFTAGSDWNLVAGVTGFSPRSLVIFDVNSSATVATFGDWTASGTGGLQVSSNKSTLAYVPPVYTAAGAATASTAHTVRGGATIANGTSTVTVTLTGAAVFAAVPSVVVGFSKASGLSGTPSGTVYFDANSSSGSSLVFVTTSSANGTGGWQINYTATDP